MRNAHPAAVLSFFIAALTGCVEYGIAPTEKPTDDTDVVTLMDTDSVDETDVPIETDDTDIPADTDAQDTDPCSGKPFDLDYFIPVGVEIGDTSFDELTCSGYAVEFSINSACPAVLVDVVIQYRDADFVPGDQALELAQLHWVSSNDKGISVPPYDSAEAYDGFSRGGSVDGFLEVFYDGFEIGQQADGNIHFRFFDNDISDPDGYLPPAGSIEVGLESFTLCRPGTEVNDNNCQTYPGPPTSAWQELWGSFGYPVCN